MNEPLIYIVITYLIFVIVVFIKLNVVSRNRVKYIKNTTIIDCESIRDSFRRQFFHPLIWTYKQVAKDLDRDLLEND